MKLSAVILITMGSMLMARTSYALPAFAMRENVSCVVCHTNGSAPHLTKTGYLYRRSGFRFPTYIGNLEKDKEALQILHHFAAGINVDYEVVTQKPPTVGVEDLIKNNFNVREAEIWPLIGGFFGNYGVWTELDMTPMTTGGGGVNLSQADLRYVSGTSDVFFNMRAGMMASEGFGASDQWIDDGNNPLFDLLSAQFNQDTLSVPLGAMGNPQMGAEFGLNYYDSHLTLGIFNGFDGKNGTPANGASPAVSSTLTPGLMNREGKGYKDYKVQLDQFLVGDRFAFTGVYYNGHISLLDSANVLIWTNSYQLYRLYLTYMAAPNVVDILGGASLGSYDYVNPGTNIVAGQFRNRGVFVGANYYVMPHLTLSGRLDYYQYVYGTDSNPRAQGYSLMASLPYENSIFVFHFKTTSSESAFDQSAGLTKDFRAEWRFLF